jgi:chromosome segregation ATPase
MGPIANPLPPATQTDVPEILQREQDRAITLLSLSPLLTSLFVSYANQAAALESTSAQPSPESEEWNVLQHTIATLQDEIRKLKLENLDLTKGLELAEVFRSSLEAVNATQQDDIESLQAELTKAKEKYDQLMADSDAAKTAHQTCVLELKACLDSCPIIEQMIIDMRRVGRHYEES